MKTITLIAAAAVFCLTGFSSCQDATLTTGDGSNVVKSSGKVITEEREIAAFNKILLEGVFNVYLLQKDKESIRVQADENILPNITTEVNDGLLTVKLKDDSKYEKMGKITVYISLKDISRLQTKGVGLVHTMDTLKLSALELELHGVGASTLTLECERLKVNSELVGTLALSGSAKELNIRHKGIGAIKAFGFKAESLNLESDGIGKAEVYASKSLRIKAKGLGGVAYKGDPQFKDIQNEGVGVVASAN